MNPDEYFNFEDRAYLSPTVSRDEQLQFLDTLRETQAQNTAQINADTYALGSQLPSNLGGLTGAEETFVARYQTPQTEQTVADLRLAAQQSALNTALSNLQNAYKKRYNDAMLNYQQRAAKAATTPSTTNDNGGDAESLGSSSTTEGGTIGGALNVPADAAQTDGWIVYNTDADGIVEYYNPSTGERMRRHPGGYVEWLVNGQWVNSDQADARQRVNDALAGVGAGVMQMPTGTL